MAKGMSLQGANPDEFEIRDWKLRGWLTLIDAELHIASRRLRLATVDAHIQGNYCSCFKAM